MMSQVEEKRMIVVSSLTIPSVESQMPQGGGGEGRVHRRRRKKAQGELASEAEAKKRRLSDEQTRYLEMNFVKERRLESSRKVHLAAEAGLEPKQVAVWFQNRRARWKNKQMEEDFLRLKSAHDAAVAQKCSLEDQVSKLQERLSEAEEEIRKLSEGTNRASGGEERGGGSPSSSPSINTNEQFMGEVWMGGADLMYIQDDCYNLLMEYCELL